MRGTLLLIVLLGLAYVSWQWLLPADAPTRLLNKAALEFADERPELTITNGEGDRFRLLPAGPDGTYLAVRGAIQSMDAEEKVATLLTQLRQLTIDSLARGGRPSSGATFQLHIAGEGREERVELIFPLRGEGPVVLAYRGLPDYYALAPTASALRPRLHFDHFRDRRLTRLPDYNRGADSVFLEVNDSLTVRLRGKIGAEATAEIIAPAAAPFADFFDELEFADRQLGDLLVYRDGQPHRVGLYRDSTWARPYVLASRAFRRRYLSVDSLPVLKMPPFVD